MERRCLIHGELVAESEARVAALDRGFLYADGLFETLRVYGGRPHRLADHWQRLADSCEFLGLPPPPNEPAALIDRVLKANALAAAAVRITWSRGPAPAGPRPAAVGLRPTLLVQARPLPADLAAAAQDGVAARVAPWPSRCRNSPLHHHKTLAYLSSVLALGAAPPGAEPLLINSHGELAEGATSNLFWVQGGAVYTPHPDAGCLPGVTRRVVLEAARAAGLPVHEGFFPVAALAGADEVFLTNAVREVLPLVTLDGRPVGSGTPGSVTRQLQRAYAADVADVADGPAPP